jgi:hypothetical protein
MSAGKTSLVLWLIGPAFLGVAAYLALASPPADIPVGEMKIIARDAIRGGAWREAKVDARGVVAGSDRPCSECHKLFTTPPGENKALVQHKDIVMNHGMNTRCLNCHDGDDRDKLVLHDGRRWLFGGAAAVRAVPRHGVPRLAARHAREDVGLVGRRMEAPRLACNECHDPHAPASIRSWRRFPGRRRCGWARSRARSIIGERELAAALAAADPRRSGRTPKAGLPPSRREAPAPDSAKPAGRGAHEQSAYP